jgi:beta-lactamase regulating signal transducer with metallopeptidase domain
MTDMSLSQTLVIGHIWQSVAIAAVLAGALILGKRMRGATRYALGVAAFAASLLLPLSIFIPGETIVTGLLKQLNAPVSMEAAAPVTVEVATLPPAEIAAAAEPAAPMYSPVNYSNVVGAPAPAAAAVPPVVKATASTTPAPTSLVTLPTINMPDIGLPLLLIWFGVAAILIARILRDLVAVERLVARAQPADLPAALKKRFSDVRVVVSPEAPGPMAAGLVRPAIVLPESIALASPGMAALLEHEHAHIRRQDMLAALGQRLVLALLWWSPALHWISRRMDEEREVACDEAAVDRTGDAKAFARSLTKQAENQLWVRAPRLAVGAIGPRSQFSRRIRRLIDIAKTGGAPAKYSGRIAFAGLALAIGVAAFVTPRFTAFAQPPADGVVDLTNPDAAKAKLDALNQANGKLDGAAPHDGEGRRFSWSGTFNDEEFAGLSSEIDAMMAELGPELQALFSELGPELDNELASLSVDLSALGVDIGTMVSQDVLANLPAILEDVRVSLEQAGIDPDSIEGWDQLSEADAQEVRAALQEARDGLKQALGPELKAEIRNALEQARAEVASHRSEIAAAMAQSQSGMAIAREALAAAREELAAARARGDFKDMKFDFSFDFDKDVEQALRHAGIALDGAASSHHAGPHSAAMKLIDAADECDIARLNTLLVDDKMDANMLIPGLGTALMAAVDEGCIEGARVLINAGADVNRGFPGHGTPLLIAIDGGSLPIAQLLLSRGADANASMPGSDTPLMTAVDEGNLALVKALVEKGADVNRKTPMSGMRNALDVALDENEDAIADYLRSKGATASRNRH